LEPASEAVTPPRERIAAIARIAATVDIRFLFLVIVRFLFAVLCAARLTKAKDPSSLADCSETYADATDESVIECRVRSVHALKLRDFSRIFLDELAAARVCSRVNPDLKVRS
jgi:hypothetical protein